MAMSQEDLACQLDVSYQQIQRYESGRNSLSAERLQSVAHALSVPVTYFLNCTDPQDPSVEDGAEKKLLSSFRTVQRAEIKSLLVNIAEMIAGWETEWNGK